MAEPMVETEAETEVQSRPDANRIALKAIRHVLTASPPGQIVVGGTPVTITVERLPAPPWPAEGLKGLDRARDGELPAPLRIHCSWEGGKTDLGMRVAWWPAAHFYSHMLGIGVTVATTGREVVWVTVALPLRAAKDGEEAAVRAQFSLFRRKGEDPNAMLKAWGYPLKTLVDRSGLELASKWQVRAFSISVPTGEVASGADKALANLIHLALLKLPFLVRGTSEAMDGAPPFSLPTASESAASASGSAEPEIEKRLAIWPLPGGVREYKTTLDAILSRMAHAPLTAEEFAALLADEYEVTGEVAIRGYQTFLAGTGLVAVVDGSLSITDAGRRYLERREAADLFDLLHASFAGLLELLVVAEVLGRVTSSRANELLVILLGTRWASKNQTSFRRNWLLSLGATDRTDAGDALTDLGRALLVRQAEEAAEVRERVTQLLEAEGPELDTGGSEEADETVNGRWLKPVPVEDGAPTAWSSERLDLKAEHVRPQLERLKLRFPSGLAERAAAALSAGKHLLLVGPPGTGKTEFAHALAEAARSEGYCHGAFVATASADWTTFDTIGGYGLEKNSSLRFRPGAFLRAVERQCWFVVDEVNRADIDRAFGELMTVLAGRATATPYSLEDGRIVKIGPEEDCTHQVPPTFRVIATMNTWDKTSLFRLSYAVQRRFAILNVGLPDDATYAALIEEMGRKGLRDPALSEQAIHALIRLFQSASLLKHRQIGPAVAIDIVRYMQRRQTDGDALAEAVGQYVLPQLEGLEEDAAVASHGILIGALEGWASGASIRELRERFTELFPSYSFSS